MASEIASTRLYGKSGVSTMASPLRRWSAARASAGVTPAEARAALNRRRGDVNAEAPDVP